MGYSWNYYSKPSITATSFAAATPDVIIPIALGITGFSLNLFSGTSVLYSFDGVNVHGDLFPTASGGPQFVQFENRVACRIWFKVTTGTSVVRVEAWRSR